MKVFNLYNDELENSNEREGWTSGQRRSVSTSAVN